MTMLDIRVLLSFACFFPTKAANIPLLRNPEFQSRSRGFGSARHAVIIGIDALGGAYFRNASQRYPTLQSFLNYGTYTTRARGVYPTVSGPNWSAYLTGMGLMESGISNNDWKLENGDPHNDTSYSIPPISGGGLPLTIFNQVKAKDQNLTTGMLFTWEWLKLLAENNPAVDGWFWSHDAVTCDGEESPIACSLQCDLSAISRTLSFIRKTKPTLTFVHLGALDTAGHYSCWGCPKYYEILSFEDSYIKLLLDTLNQTTGNADKPLLDDTLLLIVSDHGGWRNSHSFREPFTALVDLTILIRGIDGFGGVYFKNASENYTTLRSFIDQGAFTNQARGAYPISSGPNWGMYLTGMSPMEHGIFSNFWTYYNAYPMNITTYSIPPVSGRGRPDTIFTQVKAKNTSLKTGMIFTWEWLKHIAVLNDDVDEWFWSGARWCSPLETSYSCYNRKDYSVIRRTIEFIKRDKPTLTFIHLDALDSAGHSTCWGCPEYYKTLGVKDKQIKLLLDALEQIPGTTGKTMLDETFIIVVSDHGGWRGSHGFGHPFTAAVDIPMLIRGPGVVKNRSLENIYVSGLDAAVTVLNALGVEKNEFMRGRVLEGIYN